MLAVLICLRSEEFEVFELLDFEHLLANFCRLRPIP